LSNGCPVEWDIGRSLGVIPVGIESRGIFVGTFILKGFGVGNDDDSISSTVFVGSTAGTGLLPTSGDVVGESSGFESIVGIVVTNETGCAVVLLLSLVAGAFTVTLVEGIGVLAGLLIPPVGIGRGRSTLLLLVAELDCNGRAAGPKY